jgi:Cof subfamily protein (haloacid dehalogenase superfamily)
MVAVDLDNTLLRHDKTVSEYTRIVFQRLRDRGIFITFATARDFRFVTEYITPLTGIKPDILIADNGAFASYKGIDVYRKMIPFKTVNNLMQHFKLVRCISTEANYFLSGKYTNDHWSLGKKDTIMTDFLFDMTDDVLYLDGIADDSLKEIATGFDDIRLVRYSDVNLITIVHSEATKLKALTAVVEMLKMKKSNVAVFGDDYSDLELLSNFEKSVAVANAINECKDVANYICDTNENDGVAKWLEEYIL